MPEVILHHYPLSHFSEKIRRILAYKKMAWRAVEQPLMMPKPDLTPLTGGYRRVPVLQIGADIYCDSACIARRLERIQPEPACIPLDQAGVITLIEEWAGYRLCSKPCHRQPLRCFLSYHPTSWLIAWRCHRR